VVLGTAYLAANEGQHRVLSSCGHRIRLRRAKWILGDGGHFRTTERSRRTEGNPGGEIRIHEPKQRMNLRPGRPDSASEKTRTWAATEDSMAMKNRSKKWSAAPVVRTESERDWTLHRRPKSWRKSLARAALGEKSQQLNRTPPGGALGRNSGEEIKLACRQQYGNSSREKQKSRGKLLGTHTIHVKRKPNKKNSRENKLKNKIRILNSSVKIKANFP
jgi:hypothetical protein